MFYAATQLDEENQDENWKIPTVAINTIIRNLNYKDDEIVRFYACKTIENITAHSRQVGYKFATVEVAKLLLDLHFS